MSEPIDLPAALARFDEPWSPRTVAVLNDYDVRVVKTKGEFTRHRHLEAVLGNGDPAGGHTSGLSSPPVTPLSRYCDPMFDFMITTVLRKSRVRPRDLLRRSLPCVRGATKIDRLHRL